jgi:hypothetical protein
MNKALFLSLLLPFFALAQQSIQWEAHAGGLICQMSGDDYPGFAKLGFEAGIGGVNALDTKGHFVGFQVNYIRKGAFYKSGGSSPIFSNYLLSMDYIEIPITYLFPMWGVYFELGLSASHNVRFKQINNDVEFPAPTNLRWLELGLQGGVNFEINKHLVFGLKYLNSLTPIQKGTVPLSYWFRQGGMHQVIAIKLQYFFDTSTFSWNQKKEELMSE